jgi:hypothetical protein
MSAQASIYIVMVFAQLFLGSALRADVASITINEAPSLEMSNRIDIFLDPDNKTTIQDVSHPEFQQFKRNSELFPSFGAFGGAAWLRFSLHNASDREQQSILLLNTTMLDARLYFLNENGQMQEYKAGRLHVNDQETFPNMMPRFNLQFKPGQTVQYYMSVKAYVVYTIKLSINQPETFYQNQRLAHFFGGLYVGIMLIMSLYNLFIYASTRDSAYLWYVATVMTLHLGVFGQYLTNGDYFGFKIPFFPSLDLWIFKLLGFAFLVQFSRLFLHTKRVPRYDRCLNATFVLTGAFILATPFFNIAKLNAFHNIIVVTAVMSFIVYSGRLFSQGSSYARYYFIAWFPFMLMALILITLNMTKKAHLMPNMSLVLCLSACVEVLLLSMALGDKYNQMRKDKEKAEREHKEAVLAMNRSLEALVKEKTRDIRSMLDNLQLGIFTVDHNMVISSEHSRYLRTMTSSQSLHSRLLSNVLFEDAHIGHDVRDQVEAAVLASTDTDELGFMGNAHLLIRQFQRQSDKGLRDIEVDWSPIESEDGTVGKLLVCMKDVTEFNQLKKTGEVQTRRIEMLRQYLKADRAQIRTLEERMMAAADQSLQLSEDQVSSWSETRKAEFVGQVFANLHTTKAISRKLGLAYLSDAIHTGENHLHEIMDGKKSLSLATLQSIFDQITSTINDYRGVIVELGMSVQASTGTQRARNFESLVMDALSERGTLAARLGKHPPLIQLNIGEEITCNPQLEETLETLLVHLLRNSMDHGIESPETRRARSKPEQGLISLAVKKHGLQYLLEYQDDGQGLNLDRIYSRAVEKGLIQPSQALSETEIAVLIFTSGFSTKETVTEISGRGVGLDAVFRQAASVGGRIDVRLLEKHEAGRFGTWSVVFCFTWPQQWSTLSKAVGG